MAISNISSANQSASVNRLTSPPVTHLARKERSQDDNSGSTVVKLSTHARDLHRAEAEQQPPAQEHIEQINAITRSDEMAHAKLAESAKEEAKVLAAKQKEDEQFYKRINTFA